MTDKIREAATLAQRALTRLRNSSSALQRRAPSFPAREIAVIDGALREVLVGVDLKTVLPCECSELQITEAGHNIDCPFWYRAVGIGRPFLR